MTTAVNLAELRKDYALASLTEADVAADPQAQFDKWLAEAIAARCPEPTAMSLATVGADGQPSSRIVLLKGADARGLVFFTNYESRKGRELAANPRAALLFHWVELERELRIEGRVEKATDAETEAYFASRPLQSRLGAWASPQSEEIPGRAWLEQKFTEAEQRLGKEPPPPPHWGGYRLVPQRVEFWQGRRSRLHDRLVYSREAAGWRISRLAP
ncbi:MAG: pyridoxamine 5-phosphate oxidase [Betaproteobacteria bacterium]|nr:pyridoxamine 5-phosphate oxidase [Betaproteobacteria bacterium]